MVPALPVVVGLGAPERGDDAVGLAVARAVADAVTSRGLAVDVEERFDPTALIELWTGRPFAVACDAVRSGVTPGTVHVLRTGADLPPLVPGHVQETGSHDFGLASAVELARALGRLPQTVVVVGVEAASFDWGAPLSPAVADAVPEAAARTLEVIMQLLTPPGA